MECREVQEMLSAYHDGELPEADRAQVAAHLHDCAQCSAMLAAMARVDAAAGVPEPGTAYWERFNRRVEERIAKEQGASRAGVVAHPRAGWVRQQLRYLVPAAAAAVLAAVIFRNIGPGPGTPAPVQAPPAQEARPAPAPATVPTPSPGAEGSKASRKAEIPRRAEGNASAEKSMEVRIAPETPAPSTAAKEMAAGAPAAVASGTRSADSAAPAPGEAMGRGKDEAAVRKGRTSGAAMQLQAKTDGPEVAATAENRSKSAAVDGCEEARALAARGRLDAAEAAQRACLARDDSPAAQERGLVYLVELLDRQHRFAEADQVVEEMKSRFPESRTLERYLQRRPQVQALPVPSPPSSAP